MAWVADPWVRCNEIGANLMSQFGCDKCWSSEASDAWEAVTSTPIETHLIDESHYIVSIRACPSCSQRYLQVTTEVVDWEDGEDPIYRTIIPVNNEERARLTISKPLDTSILETIGGGRRSLRYAWPKGKIQVPTGEPEFMLAYTIRNSLLHKKIN